MRIARIVGAVFVLFLFGCASGLGVHHNHHGKTVRPPVAVAPVPPLITSVTTFPPESPSGTSLATTPTNGTGDSLAAVSAPVAALRRRAEAGDATAQHDLGLMYDTGNGVPKDAQQSAVWYLKAAYQGDARSQRNLGVMYCYGRGVPKDAGLSAGWFQRAADQGNADAQYKLGVMYYNGWGVPQSPQQATSWWQKAAENGSSDARAQLQASQAQGQNQPDPAVMAAIITACIANQQAAAQDLRRATDRIANSRYGNYQYPDQAAQQQQQARANANDAMEKAFLAIQAANEKQKAASQSFRRNCMVSYETEAGWSSESPMEVEFATGSQLNQRMPGRNFTGGSAYALLWFAQNKVAILQSDSFFVSLGTTFREEDFKSLYLIHASLDLEQVYSNEQRKWRIRATDFGIFIDPRSQ